MLKYFILLTIFIQTNKFTHKGKYLNILSYTVSTDMHKDIPEDEFLTAPQLIKKYGYSVESHEVKTDDGYLITMHRIPRGKLTKDPHNTPVLLMHGLLCSSVDWIINRPGKSLGYLLADRGYDVWMGNARGNTYSRKHISLNPDSDREFWNFSWNEIGYYDLPAMIDHILETTKKNKLHYVGHSQGGTTFLVMSSERIEYNDKILSMQGLAPAAYVSNGKSPIIKYLAPYVKNIIDLFDIIEFLPNSDILRFLTDNFCDEDSSLLNVCTNVIFMFCGYNPSQLNTTALPVYLSHTPAGASSNQIIHYFQEYISAKFRKFDYGPEKNMEVYNTEIPPDYDLSKITAPVCLHYTENDLLVDPKDTEKLFDELGNPVGKYKVPMFDFNHLDFMWAINATNLLYDKVMNLMEKFNES